MITVGQSVLILAQEGAVLAPLVASLQRAEPAQLEVLQQEPAESLSAFRQRLPVLLAGLERANRCIEHGAFVAKSGFGLPDVLATVALLSSLVATMVAFGTGHVYLCGHEGDAQAGYALEALADAMRDQVRGTGVEVVTDEGLVRSLAGEASEVPPASAGEPVGTGEPLPQPA